MAVRKSIAVLGLATLLVVGCVSYGPWHRASEFRGQLRCGFSPEKVLEIAKHFEELVAVGAISRDWVIEATGDSPRMILVISPGGTIFELGFNENRLETVYFSWISGFTQGSSEMRQNICTGEKSVRIQIVIPSSESPLYGNEFRIDGRSFGRLDSSKVMYFWIYPGEHVVEVFLSSEETFAKIFTVPDDTSRGDHYEILHYP